MFCPNESLLVVCNYFWFEIQSIRVQIREEQVLESSPYQSSVLSFQSIPTTVGGSTPLPTNHLPPLRIKNNDIVFEKTLIGTVTSKLEASFIITSIYSMLDLANSKFVVSNSLLFQTQNHLP